MPTDSVTEPDEPQVAAATDREDLTEVPDDARGTRQPGGDGGHVGGDALGE